MNTTISQILAAVSLISPAFSLTIDELSPTALAGKTLNCTIDHSASPFATTGTWTATFESSPSNGFTIHKVTGDTVDCSGTVAFKSFSNDIYTYTITPFIKGESACSLYLWIFDGAFHYEVELMHGSEYIASEGGTFTLGTAAKTPDIDVQQPARTNLTDGVSAKSFGTVKIGPKEKSKTFTIKNTGKTKLTGLAIRKSGANKGDFAVVDPEKTSLAAGASTTFKVTFKPSAKGPRNAAIAISSNDPDENPFDIRLSGEGAK